MPAFLPFSPGGAPSVVGVVGVDMMARSQKKRREQNGGLLEMQDGEALAIQSLSPSFSLLEVEVEQKKAADPRAWVALDDLSISMP